MLNALPDMAGPELVKMLRHRIRAFHHLHWLQQINRQRSDGASLVKIGGLLAMHPSIWPLIVRRVIGALEHRAITIVCRVLLERSSVHLTPPLR